MNTVFPRNMSAANSKISKCSTVLEAFIALRCDQYCFIKSTKEILCLKTENSYRKMEKLIFEGIRN